MVSTAIPNQCNDNGCQPTTVEPDTVRVPKVDILETPAELLIILDVPGAGQGDVAVEFDKGQLSIRAKVAGGSNAGDDGYLLREYRADGYRRSFRLGDEIDPQRISAELDCGILTVRLPKVEATKPRKIAVITG